MTNKLNQKQKRFLQIQTYNQLSTTKLINLIASDVVNITDEMFIDQNKQNYRILFNVNCFAFVQQQASQINCRLKINIKSNVPQPDIDGVQQEPILTVLHTQIININTIYNLYNNDVMIDVYQRLISDSRSKHNIISQNIDFYTDNVFVQLQFLDIDQIISSNKLNVRYYINGFQIDVADPRIQISQHGMLLYYTPSKFLQFSNDNGFKISGFNTQLDQLQVQNNVRLGTHYNSSTTLMGTLYYDKSTQPQKFVGQQIRVLVVDQQNGQVKYALPHQGGLGGVQSINQQNGQIIVQVYNKNKKLYRYNENPDIKQNPSLARIIKNLKYDNNQIQLFIDNVQRKKTLTDSIHISWPVLKNDTISFYLYVKIDEQQQYEVKVFDKTIQPTENILLEKTLQELSVQNKVQIYAKITDILRQQHITKTISISYYDQIFIFTNSAQMSHSNLNNLTSDSLIYTNASISNVLSVKNQYQYILNSVGHYLYVALPAHNKTINFLVNNIPTKFLRLDSSSTFNFTNSNSKVSQYFYYRSQKTFNDYIVLTIEYSSLLIGYSKISDKLTPLSNIKLLDSKFVQLQSLSSNNYIPNTITELQALTNYIQQNSFFIRTADDTISLIDQQQNNTNLVWNKDYGLKIIGNQEISNNLTVKGKILEYSDLRLKQNIRRLSFDQQEDIYKINIVKFNYKDKTDLRYGVIAQQLKMIYPNLVCQQEQFMKVNYLQMVPLLIKTVQNLKKQIEMLKKEK